MNLFHRFASTRRLAMHNDCTLNHYATSYRSDPGKRECIVEREPLKVAVWATGGVGRFAIRTVVDRPNMELAGGWGHSPAKDGKDLGVLAGINGERASGALVHGLRHTFVIRTASDRMRYVGSAA
jgi:hypothetical protein